MAARIPQQRATSPESPKVTTVTPQPCAVEDCERDGALRYFPSYRLSLCTEHFIRAADKHRSVGRYW